MIRMPADVLEAVIAHARSEAPRECCGFLIGSGDTIKQSIPLENAAETPLTQFESSPQSTFAAYRQMSGLELDLVAVYHSHPLTHAVPSATDRAQHDMPQVACVIVSLATDPPVVRAWQMPDMTELAMSDASENG